MTALFWILVLTFALGVACTSAIAIALAGRAQADLDGVL